MKAGILTALLLRGMLAPMTTVVACPIEEAIDLATAVALCAASAVNPDSEVTIVDDHPQQTSVAPTPTASPEAANAAPAWVRAPILFFSRFFPQPMGVMGHRGRPASDRMLLARHPPESNPI